MIATGANPRELGLAKEKELIGHGVAYCASCDGMFYKDKIVVVVGGGNSAVSDAVLLSRIAKKVIIVHRRDTLRATKIYHDQLLKTENIEFRWNNTVNELIYGERLTGVRLKDTVTGEENIIECDGLFVSIGRNRQQILDNQIELDNKGYIVAGENTENEYSGCLCCRRCQNKVTSSDSNSSCRWCYGSTYGRKVYGSDCSNVETLSTVLDSDVSVISVNASRSIDVLSSE